MKDKEWVEVLQEIRKSVLDTNTINFGSDMSYTLYPKINHLPDRFDDKVEELLELVGDVEEGIERLQEYLCLELEKYEEEKVG